MLKRISGCPAKCLLVLMIWCATFAFLTPARSQDQASKPKVQKVPVQQTNEVSGSQLFHSYCAVCHGQDGKGNGPAAAALKSAPANLTLLTKNNGGKFPADHVKHILSTNSEYAVHGSPDMPIWGPIFRRMGSDQNLGYLRAQNLTEYIRSIQEK